MQPLFVSNQLYALIFAAAYLIWLVPEMIRSFSRRRGAGTNARDRFSGIILIAGIWIGNAVAFNVAFDSPALAIFWDRTLLFWSGIFLMLAGVAFRWYAIHVLGQYFSVVIAIQPGHKVVEDGPYRYVRHPSYSGALITLLGIGLVLGNWLSLLALVFFAVLGYGYRIFVEERVLQEAFGDSYRDYMKRTKRIIPFVI